MSGGKGTKKTFRADTSSPSRPRCRDSSQAAARQRAQEPPPAHLAPSCAEAGVLGILPGMIGVAQATEAIKLLLGQGEPLVGRLLTYDSLKMTFRTLKLRRDPKCPACGENPTITSYIDYEGFCAGPAH